MVSDTDAHSPSPGFFRSIALSKGNSLQDTLRLLTLWFKYGYHDMVNIAISQGVGSVSIDVWLEVIPQIIARIHISNSLIRSAIAQLLNLVGRAHPQALIYPLLVAAKSQVMMRKEVANSIMDRMRDQNALLVEQASLVSHELIRVAILWHELWTEGLEEASRFYFAEHNPEGMFGVLEPLHDMIERVRRRLPVSFSNDCSVDTLLSIAPGRRDAARAVVHPLIRPRSRHRPRLLPSVPRARRRQRPQPSLGQLLHGLQKAYKAASAAADARAAVRLAQAAQGPRPRARRPRYVGLRATIFARLLGHLRR